VPRSNFGRHFSPILLTWCTSNRSRINRVSFTVYVPSNKCITGNDVYDMDDSLYCFAAIRSKIIGGLNNVMLQHGVIRLEPARQLDT